MNFGWIKDSPSDKDLKFSSIQHKIIKLASDNTDSEYYIKEYTPISNQLNLSSCVGNSSVDALEILMGQKGNIIQLSRLFAYYNARKYHNATKVDGGTQIRYVFDSFKQYGICPESTWPYDESQVFKQPILEAYKEGQDNLITAYYNIDSNRCDSIEAAIRANHPTVFGTGISQEYLDGKKEVYDIPENILGYHAQLICGIRRINGQRQFYIRNSWGNNWCINGHSYMTEDYINSNISSDFWVPTLMEELLI